MPEDRHIPGYALPRTVLRFVGIACLFLAIVALLYALPMTVRVLSTRTVDPAAPYTLHFFLLFTLIVLAVQVCMLFCGSQLLRYRTNVRHILLWCCVAMVAVFFFVGGCLWTATNRQIALSAGSATGIGLGGLMVYLMTLFPLWAPPIVFWAHKRLHGLQAARRKAGCCIHCGYDLRASTGACPECGMSE